MESESEIIDVPEDEEVEVEDEFASPMHSQYQFLAAVSIATSGNEAEFYSKIKGFTPPARKERVTALLQALANRESVTIVCAPQTFHPESGVSKATLYYDHSTWKAAPAVCKPHINISETLKELEVLNTSYDIPIYQPISRFPKKVRVGLFGGVGEGKSTLVELVYGPNISTKSEQSGSQTSWIHEFNFTTDAKFRLSAVFVEAEEIDRLREECEEELKNHGKLKETKNEVRSYFGNALVEELDAYYQSDNTLLTQIYRPADIDILQAKYTDVIEMDSLEAYQECIKDLQTHRQFVESVSSEIPHTHAKDYYIPDLTMIDLPGSNDMNTNRAKMVEKIIGEVDVIIFVSNQRNNMTAKTIEKNLFKHGINSMQSKRSARILNVATFGDLLIKNGKSYKQAWKEAYDKFQSEASAPQQIRRMPYLLTGYGVPEGNQRFIRFLKEIVAIKANELEALIKNNIQVLEQGRTQTDSQMQDFRKYFTDTIPRLLEGCKPDQWRMNCSDFWLSKKRFGGCGGYGVLIAVFRRKGIFTSTKRGYINIVSDILDPLRKLIVDNFKPSQTVDVQFIGMAQTEVIRDLEQYAQQNVKYYLPEFPGDSVNELIIEFVENLQIMYKNLIKKVQEDFSKQSDTMIGNLNEEDVARIEEKVTKLKELLAPN